MNDYINIKRLTMDELVGVVNLYPWFGAARKELCLRMSKMGGSSWGKAQYADAAMYVASRKEISGIWRAGSKEDYSDKDMEKLLKTYIHEEDTSGDRSVRVVGGDYFTQAQYDGVKKEEDNVFSRFAVKAKPVETEEEEDDDLSDIFCTETLAQIYEEQGYYDQAKRIYSKLLLNFPEKSAYFAALIQKMEANMAASK